MKPSEKNKEYERLTQVFRQAELGITPAELHGFLSGVIVSNQCNDKEKWHKLAETMLNDDKPFSENVVKEIAYYHELINFQLSEPVELDYTILLNESSVFNQADSLAEWLHFFLLAFGYLRPDLVDKSNNRESVEGLVDLYEISRLGYNSEDDEQELKEAMVEILYYVKTLVEYYYDVLHGVKYDLPKKKSKTQKKHTVH